MQGAQDEHRQYRLDLPKAKKTVLPNGDTVWTWWVPPDWKRFQEDDEKKDVVRC